MAIPAPAWSLSSLLKIAFFVGDEACRVVAFGAKTGDESQIFSVSEGQVTPYVVSYFFNSLLAPQLKWVIIWRKRRSLADDSGTVSKISSIVRYKKMLGKTNAIQ
jgi:hypothetical protein